MLGTEHFINKLHLFRLSGNLHEKLGKDKVTTPDSKDTSKFEANKFDGVVLVKVLQSPISAVENIILLADILRVLKPSGRLVVNQLSLEELESTLILSGFTNYLLDTSAVIPNCVSCCKPSFEVGGSSKLNLGTKEDAKAVWEAAQKGIKIDDTIDPDMLIDSDDLKKPDAASLLVCATTGKKKACKDCSCGLDKILAGETGDDQAPPAEQSKSSCGSCYLGDAFRCAACPYLGMPAFKPGEKVTLNASMLQDDI